jgi:class 3 adenylate cyclase
MGVFEAKFRLSKSRSGKDAILVHGGEEVTITYKSELPANYLEHIENKRDPKEAFFFSFKVNSPLRPKDVLNDMKKYLDPSVFEKIRRGEFLGLRKMPITVAFWDIRGFSQMCDILRADTKLIVGFLRDYSDLATQVITKHGGILDKFIGDGVMALFGVFENDSDEAAVAAVSAALEFRSGFNKLLEKWMPIWSSTQEQSFTIEIGCGINTGEAMVGSLGGIREQFTAVGRSVNIASRLENRSKENKILISRTTQKRVNSFFETRYVGTIRSMKNIVGNYPYYEVIKKSKHLPEIEVDYT